MSKLTWIEYDILDIYNHEILDMVYTDGIYFYLDGSLSPNANYNIISGKLYGSTITKEMIDYLTERNFKINNLDDLTISKNNVKS